MLQKRKQDLGKLHCFILSLSVVIVSLAAFFPVSVVEASKIITLVEVVKGW